MGAVAAGPPRRSTDGSSMRKLIVSSFISLDGVIESPMTWISPFFDDESKEYAHKQLVDVEVFLLGRVTYDVFSARWPPHASSLMGSLTSSTCACIPSHVDWGRVC